MVPDWFTLYHVFPSTVLEPRISANAYCLRVFSFVPVVLGYVQSKGGDASKSLLATDTEDKTAKNATWEIV